MGGLYKKEVVIRSGSSISKEGAFEWVGGWLDNFYQGAEGQDDFFAGLFDTRDNTSYLVFHSACQSKFELPSLVIKTSAEAVASALSSDSVANGLTEAAVKAIETAISEQGAQCLDEITSALNYAKAQITAHGSDYKDLLTAEKGSVLEAMTAEFESLSNDLNTVASAHRSELAELWEETKKAGTDATSALAELRESIQAQFGQDSAAYQGFISNIQTLSDSVSASLLEMKSQNEQAIEYNQQAAQYISSLAESEEQSLKLLGELEDKVNTATNRIDSAASQSEDLINQLEAQSQSGMEGAGGESLTENRVLELISENSSGSGDDSESTGMASDPLSRLEVADMIRDAITTFKESMVVSSNGTIEVEVDPASTEDFA